MQRRPRLSPLNLSPEARLRFTFERVKRFVSRSSPRLFHLSRVRLNIGCQEIHRYRATHPGKRGDRAFMHTEHKEAAVCSAVDAGRLPENYQVGLILHEFGHIATHGGEQAADEWVLHSFGIMIHYMGPLEIEWVSDQDLRKVLPRTSSSRPSRLRTGR
jgi:hypothetical protein